ncbi:MAG: DUF2461 domain-containing protein [Williamsia sp.]|nr:DUF2461 domain-containing protein [Williamsia sp.]
MLQHSTLTFLKDLHKNNNKPWFDGNRQRYEAAKQDFEQFVAALLQKLSPKDEAIRSLNAKDCLFRINRDVRFSKDKSPYKTNMGASISKGGKKSPFAGYYFHCEPGASFAGGGIWMPEPGDIKKIRQEIDYCFDEFSKIVGSKRFVSVYGDLSKDKEFTLVNLPKGYEKDNPAAEYLRLKSWIATKDLSDSELTSASLSDEVTKTFEALMPLVKFINRALE